MSHDLIDRALAGGRVSAEEIEAAEKAAIYANAARRKAELDEAEQRAALRGVAAIAAALAGKTASAKTASTTSPANEQHGVGRIATALRAADR